MWQARMPNSQLVLGIFIPLLCRIGCKNSMDNIGLSKKCVPYHAFYDQFRI